MSRSSHRGRGRGRVRVRLRRRRKPNIIAFSICVIRSASLSVLLSRIQAGKEMLGRAVAMLTRLVDRFDTEESYIEAPFEAT